jgi:ParB-like chromosome segregation protein Spo0J
MSDRSSISSTASSYSQRKAKALYRDLNLAVEYVPIDQLKAYERALRTHSAAHVDQLEASIGAFGLVQPILVDAHSEIIGGHGIFEAAVKAGYAEVPILRLSHLGEAQKRTLRIALNGLAEKSGWNKQLLAIEFKELLEIELSLDLDFGLPLPVLTHRRSISWSRA